MKRLIASVLLSTSLLAPTLAMAAEKQAAPQRISVREALRPSEIKASANRAWNHDNTNMALVAGSFGLKKAIAYQGGPKEKLIQGASRAVQVAVAWKLTNKFLAATAPKTPEQKAQIQAKAQADAKAQGKPVWQTRVVNAIRGPQTYAPKSK